MPTVKRSFSPSPSACDNKKPRVQSASSRGVANLTPDQLAKKRANDREAQRAIRERTKNQIESLERRIREYQELEPHKQLQDVLRHKERVEEEFKDIKRRLEAVWVLLEPILSRTSDGQPPAHLLPTSGPGVADLHHDTDTPSGVTTPGATGDAQWQSPGEAVDARYGVGHHGFVTQASRSKLDLGSARLGLDFLLDGMPRPPQAHGLLEKPLNPGASDRSIPGEYRRSSTSIHHPMDAPSDTFLPGHAVHCRNGPPTCQLDKILLTFLTERRSLQLSGASLSTLIGPAYPTISLLLEPSQSTPPPHPLSQVIAEILATFKGLSSLPERVAIFYSMFLLMRWIINPTQANYDRLPFWMCPRASQLFELHPIWIDFLPFPQLRDVLVRNCQHDYPFDVFFIPFTKALSLNWAYADKDCLLRIDGELTLNPVFETHLRDLQNWTLGPSFDKAFPALEGRYKSKRQSERQ
ncbi:hypothetical protein K3495_g5033 [Podosphaera aphanis]|nr:hypothetical protein K3495_g5033 [Podosphaera aphanis]